LGRLKKQACAVRGSIIVDIYVAFADLVRDDETVSWSEARAIDDLKDEAECLAARRSDKDAHGNDLVNDPESDPLGGYAPFGFMNAAGLRYYLPPTMVRVLRNEGPACEIKRTLGMLAHEALKEPAGFLTKPQRACLFRFLVFMYRHDTEAEQCGGGENYWMSMLQSGLGAYLRA
jgi:hypothetical protein